MYLILTLSYFSTHRTPGTHIFKKTSNTMELAIKEQKLVTLQCYRTIRLISRSSSVPNLFCSDVRIPLSCRKRYLLKFHCSFLTCTRVRLSKENQVPEVFWGRCLFLVCIIGGRGFSSNITLQNVS